MLGSVMRACVYAVAAVVLPMVGLGVCASVVKMASSRHYVHGIM